MKTRIAIDCMGGDHGPYLDPAMSKAGGLWGQAWRLPATGAKLAATASKPGFESAPPAGAKAAGKPAKGKKRK